MNDEIMIELMTTFLKECHPIIRMKITPEGKRFHLNRKPIGQFKRVVKINSHQIYRVSDADQRYNALNALSKIMCKVFHAHQDDTIPILKKHLHIK